MTVYLSDVSTHLEIHPHRAKEHGIVVNVHLAAPYAQNRRENHHRICASNVRARHALTTSCKRAAIKLVKFGLRGREACAGVRHYASLVAAIK